jgi:carbon-monoxide dehydrogenase medium subunit
VIPARFDYQAPGTLEEALQLLARHGDAAKILAGGHSLIPAMRFRLAQPEVLIDLNRLDPLRYVREEGDVLAIGAMTPEAWLEESPVVASQFPLLADTASVIADPIVRNRGTVGGNLAHADPANDHPATMLAYGATLVAVGAAGRRTIAIDDFFVGLFENSLKPGEILTEIRIPKPGKGAGGAYVKMERKVGDYATSAVAVQLALEGDTIRTVRIGLTNVNPTPMRATKAEAALTGQRVSDAAIEAAAKAAAAQCDPSGDLRGSADYKRDVTRVLTKRAIRRAIARAQGKQA